MSGRRKKEEGRMEMQFRAMVLAIKNVLTVERGC
jgi:hypothetical protein